ncbi:MAG: penicillin-binding protein 1A, partial [Myxococcota bacterium]
LRSKWEELLNALRLEHRYSKADILEFYANQFHVSANGRGIGIAARYFFDKPAAELDLLESAFVAGMVKGPANYDPFIGRTEERREAASERARVRVRYVLDRMLLREALDESEHKAALAELEVRFTEGRFFNRGQFRYDSHVLLDEVEARLAEAPFPALFAELGIDNPSTAGIQIVTTIDVDAQREATWSLWHHLTEVGPVLEEWTIDKLALGEDAVADELTDAPQVHGFYTARVDAVEEGTIRLGLGAEGCIVDKVGIERIAGVLARARKGERWRTGSAADIAEVVGAVEVGDVVFASMREEGLCDLEIRPELQGATVILERGRLRAMVGGNDNRNFNRAVTAQRQLGSTWKPLIYAAALQLRWSPLDRLDNREGAFPFEGVWYYPRAAHSAPETISLAWAGTDSENLASVWLLYHLTDRLSSDAFKQIAEQVTMTRQPDESSEDYLVRVRDEYGIISTRSRFPELAWTAARLELAAELSETDPAQALAVQSLLYADDADREAERVRRRYSGEGVQRRLEAIHNNPHRLNPLAEQCVVEAEKLAAVSATAVALLEVVNDASRPRFHLFGRDRPPEEAAELLTPIAELPPMSGLSHLFTPAETEEGTPLELLCAASAPEGARPLVGADLEALGRASQELAQEDVEQLMVEGRLSVGTLRRLDRIARRRALVMEAADPYSWSALQHHPDFRLLVGIRYVSQLARQLGVRTELPPVMSMPLGAADITLEEAAGLYQGLLTGQAYRFPGETTAPIAAQTRDTQLIAQIRDREGNVLYRAWPEPVVASDPVAGKLTAGILHNVVSWGTGRRARGSVRVGEVTVPLFGKTGTTNSYRNAAFCGFVPTWRGEGWSWEDGFTIATYVGYDDNRDMRRGSVRLAGASGALPAWIGAAQGLAAAGLLGEPEGSSWSPGADFSAVPVAEGSGLPLAAGAEGTGRSVWVWGERAPWTEDFSPQRRLAPLLLEAPAEPTPHTAIVAQEEVEDIWIPEMGP